MTYTTHTRRLIPECAHCAIGTWRDLAAGCCSWLCWRAERRDTYTARRAPSQGERYMAAHRAIEEGTRLLATLHRQAFEELAKT